ncbi:MAG: hypothetical protein KAJ14_14775 [Candidatus Omnitrophica bacterium]|nr:hypothetical protein [Candidatus Omnitrophota bacterium]
MVVKDENKIPCRIVGVFLMLLLIIFKLGGRFPQGADGQGAIFLPGWFREIFLVLLCLMFFLGLIFASAGFSPRKGGT